MKHIFLIASLLFAVAGLSTVASADHPVWQDHYWQELMQTSG